MRYHGTIHLIMPRLLLFSDVHSDHDACRRLVDRAPEVDVVVGAGDFCVARRGLEDTIAVLSDIAVPTVLVPGNSESARELRTACQGWNAAHVLHGEGCTVDGLPFFGIGGGIPVTPFGAWSYDFSEQEAAALLAGCPAGAVLVSHSPPKNVVDRDSNGRNLGSTAVRNAIEEKAPQLVVCGHIHGSWEERGLLGRTTVINAGPNGVVWEVPVEE
jgi:Icc-related predicted phosphoesterase